MELKLKALGILFELGLGLGLGRIEVIGGIWDGIYVFPYSSMEIYQKKRGGKK